MGTAASVPVSSPSVLKRWFKKVKRSASGTTSGIAYCFFFFEFGGSIILEMPRNIIFLAPSSTSNSLERYRVWVEVEGICTFTCFSFRIPHPLPHPLRCSLGLGTNLGILFGDGVFLPQATRPQSNRAASSGGKTMLLRGLRCESKGSGC